MSGKTFDTIDPAMGNVLASLPACADVDVAVGSARAAFESGCWSDLHPSERKSVLARLADLIMDQR